MRRERAQPLEHLPPSRAAAKAAWRQRVVAARRQSNDAGEGVLASGPYGYADRRFRMDPRRQDDDVLAALLELAKPTDTWLDIGAGVGRFALPLALRVARVIALEPSAEALGILTDDARAAGIDGVETLEAAWPISGGEPPTADVVLMAHVGYAVEDIGSFLDAAEASARRTCIVVMGERPMSVAPPLLWAHVHGEDRIATPALPELLTVLLSRGSLPSISYGERGPVVRASLEELVGMARRQLRVGPGTAAEDRLVRAVHEVATRRDAGWALDWTSTRIGIAAWQTAARS